MSDERVLETYSLQILTPESSPAEEGSAFSLEQQEKRVLANLPAMLEDAQENLSDVLPEGWSVRIRRWNDA